ncbi:hypothetical protein [Halobellus sp. EA9]|uniref:hypothetical protein n=1 Tax=Halobellus sp. EA9 TaxID=3421647 RepID=UPI003EBA897A
MLGRVRLAVEDGLERGLVPVGGRIREVDDERVPERVAGPREREREGGLVGLVCASVERTDSDYSRLFPPNAVTGGGVRR